jgi:hypothetical protein
VPTLDDDRVLSPDIEAIRLLIASRELENACGGVVK